MVYNFDEKINREGTESVKYDLRNNVFGKADVIPMWVADMDFRTPDFIREAVIERAKYDVYGYTFREDAYFEAIAAWIRRRHQWDVRKEWMTYTPGVVAAFNMAVLGLTKEGDEVIIQPPVYPPFFHAVESHGRKLVTNPLIDTDDGFIMDYELLEKQAKTAKMLILSNPHNPVGRCWTRDELKRLGDICMRNNVLVFSDEIHCDLVLPGHKHVPFASVCEEFAQHSLTAHAASKTFNLAGMATSTIIVPNEELRKTYVNFVESTEIHLGNIFGKIATKTAMEKGEEWLQQLLVYIQGNIDYVVDYINKELPKIRVHKAEATYMLWLDFSAYNLDNKELNHKMIFEAGLGLNNGKEFGKQGEKCLRINLACPRSVVAEAMKRIKEVF
ncbi:MAG: PatB family C-S lyase [Bacteroidales bacterium]|jgi:cystathionine beta-lyase|nr:PatB family C-S lyase [Bacteroidales bacterium]